MSARARPMAESFGADSNDDVRGGMGGTGTVSSVQLLTRPGSNFLAVWSLAAWFSVDGVPTGAVGIQAVALEAWLAAPVVTVDGEVFAGRDVVAAGVVAGRWGQLESDLRTGLRLVAERRAPDAAVIRAVVAFRRERGLISAEEFIAWLEQRELSLADVRGACERQLLRERCVTVDGPEPRVAAIAAALPAEAICSGAARACGSWLADRVLAGAAVGAPAPDAEVVEQACELERGTVAANVVAEGAAPQRARIARMVGAAQAYEQWTGELCSEAAIAGVVRRRAVDWLWFELDGVTVPPGAAEGAAGEVALMLREDRLELREVAAVAGLEPAARGLWLVDASERLRSFLAGATPGEVVGPVPEGGAHSVWVVRARRAADPADPAIRERARTEIVDGALRRRRAGRVRWHDRD